MERITPYDRKQQVAKIAVLTKRVQESREALAKYRIGTTDMIRAEGYDSQPAIVMMERQAALREKHRVLIAARKAAVTMYRWMGKREDPRHTLAQLIAREVSHLPSASGSRMGEVLYGLSAEVDHVTFKIVRATFPDDVSTTVYFWLLDDGYRVTIDPPGGRDPVRKLRVTLQ